MDSNVWNTAEKALTPGETLRSRTGALYVVASFDDKRAVLQRPETGSTVNVTRRKVEAVAERLASGESIPFRGISGTVAIEQGILLALGALVVIDEDARTYRGAS